MCTWLLVRLRIDIQFKPRDVMKISIGEGLTEMKYCPVDYLGRDLSWNITSGLVFNKLSWFKVLFCKTVIFLRVRKLLVFIFCPFFFKVSIATLYFDVIDKYIKWLLLVAVLILWTAWFCYGEITVALCVPGTSCCLWSACCVSGTVKVELLLPFNSSKWWFVCSHQVLSLAVADTKGK